MTSIVYSQSTGINNPNPDTNAALDIRAVGIQGLLIPRHPGNVNGSFVLPGAVAQGLMYYDITNQVFRYHVGNNVWQTLGTSSGDNLGNHTATQNIVLGTNWLSGDGGNEGVFVNNIGNVGIGTSTPRNDLQIGDRIGLWRLNSFNEGTVLSSNIYLDAGVPKYIINAQATLMAFSDQGSGNRLSFSIYPAGTAGGNLGPEKSLLRIDSSGEMRIEGGLRMNGQLEINGSAGSIGDVLVSQGSGTPPVWQSAGIANSWSLTGNAGTSAANYLGTTDLRPIFFRTNATDRMFLSETGLLGINTVVPQTELHVYGTSRVSNTTAGSAKYLDNYVDASGLSHLYSTDELTITTSSGPVKFDLNGAGTIMQMDDGNAGIQVPLSVGTLAGNGGVTLDINGSIATRANTATITAINNIDALNASNTSFMTVTTSASPYNLRGIVTGADGQHLIIRNQTAYVMTVIEESGAVAIANYRIQTGVGNLSVPPNGLVHLIYSANRWATVAAPSQSQDNLGNHTTIQNIVLGANWLSGDGDNEGIRISPSGLVGIGSTNPAERLDISGNVKFSGALMPNNLAGTAGQILTSSGAGNAPTWTTPPTFVSPANTVIKGNAAGTAQTASQIFDDGNSVNITAPVTGIAKMNIQNEVSGGPNTVVGGTKGLRVAVADNGSSQVTGIEVQLTGDNMGQQNGIFSSVNGTSGLNRGVVALASNSAGSNFGLDAYATGNSGTNYGIRSNIGGTQTSAKYGLYVSASGSGTKYGVYSQGEDQNYFSGNVGIGTTVPTAQLHTTGSVRFAALTGPGVLTVDASGNVSSTSGSAVVGSGTANKMAFWTSANSLSANTNFHFDNTNLRLAIGNAAPAYRLDISTAASDNSFDHYLRFGAHNTPGSNSGGLVWNPNFSSYTKTSAAIRAVCEGSFFRLGLAFFTGNNSDVSTSAVERMRIDMNGNVGIGTTTPTQSLHVADEGLGGNSNVIFEGHSATGTRGPGLQMIRSKGTLASPTAVVNGDYLGGINASGRTASAYNSSSSIDFNVDGTVSGTSVPGRIVFSTTTSGASTTSEKMRIDNTGNVGIGTANPLTTLQVNGSVSAGTISYNAAGTISDDVYFVRLLNSTGLVPYTLVLPTPTEGRMLMIKRFGNATTQSISPPSGSTLYTFSGLISSAGSFALNSSNYSGALLVAAGGNWWLISYQ